MSQSSNLSNESSSPLVEIDNALNEPKRKEAIAYLRKMIQKIQESRDEIIDTYSDLKDMSESNLKELRNKVQKLGFKFEKTRMYFDSSIFPRDHSLRVIDVDSNLEELSSSLSENIPDIPDGEHRNPCKVFKDLFTGYDRC